ncbi:hypothetical protein Pmani_005722 [Petrolisthes manimaculis]|uniref:Uncharacterized protein n=1 Tax=Petrolisthes manimaculis TaxID=1843537 RepID=A0AAE1QEE8_9EUCA|nr:hypothetical protein Pmani_005722 [Petrolisthes manimaculis]
MEFNRRLIRSVCSSWGIPLISWSFLEELKASCKITHFEEGNQADCMRLEGENYDWVLKHHTHGVWIMIEEVKYLRKVVGIPGVQVLVGVCPQKQLIITEYCGKNLYNICEANDTLDASFLLRMLRDLT